jgi:RNA polymerase sigma-70 factor, ECF subfamily
MPKAPNRNKIKDKDFELVRAINAGETERFYELVKRYEQSLYNFGYRMCGNVQDTEDVVQETFLNIFRYLKSFRHESKFKNWMYKIATSTCIKKRRKSKFAPEKELSLDDFIPKDHSDQPTDIPDWAVLPLEKVLNDELADQLNTAILSLPDKYRVVIVLRDIEGFSTEEAAQILNLTPSNVKVRLHRARLFVRDRMKDYFNDAN